MAISKNANIHNTISYLSVYRAQYDTVKPSPILELQEDTTMKKIVLSILLFCGASVAHAATVHGEHAAPVPAQDHPKTAQHLNMSHGNNSKAPISNTLIVSDCWIRSLPRPTPSAGYFLIKNTGVNDAKLSNLTITEFDEVSLHQTTNEGGKSKMSMAHEILIPAGGELKFKPGSYHAMLEKPNQTLSIGTHVNAEFTFEPSEKAITTCEIKPANTVAE
ncbi:copper chaperone PCu(A)C [Alcaligenaceae bacterium]|uniref:copper chaperone PCu(A)C n=1 Tax=Pusillimonas sp. (strain T7-7) TaxID=1007105 RepID=UPI000A06AD70|nr:copper chaperone PCu(A)C [Pusillimonas sp. T7-7]NYT60665.1 copper chaperone PCu(A)C [Alcaligenaceae bacterium]